MKEEEEQATSAKRQITDKEGQVKEEEEQAPSANRKRTDKEGSRNQRRYSPRKSK